MTKKYEKKSLYNFVSVIQRKSIHARKTVKSMKKV